VTEIVEPRRVAGQTMLGTCALVVPPAAAQSESLRHALRTSSVSVDIAAVAGAGLVRCGGRRTADLCLEEKVVQRELAAVRHDDTGAEPKIASEAFGTTPGITPAGFRLRNLQVCTP
jgi:hypothetical protein